MIKRVCNICEKEFDEFDTQEGFGFHYRSIGYGSGFDGSSIELDMCCDCFDKLMNEYIIPKCKISPVEEV